jgi:chromosome segregation ATPase
MEASLNAQEIANYEKTLQELTTEAEGLSKRLIKIKSDAKTEASARRAQIAAAETENGEKTDELRTKFAIEKLKIEEGRAKKRSLIREKLMVPIRSMQGLVAGGRRALGCGISDLQKLLKDMASALSSIGSQSESKEKRIQNLLEEIDSAVPDGSRFSEFPKKPNCSVSGVVCSEIVVGITMRDCAIQCELETPIIVPSSRVNQTNVIRVLENGI